MIPFLTSDATAAAIAAQAAFQQRIGPNVIPAILQAYTHIGTTSDGVEFWSYRTLGGAGASHTQAAMGKFSAKRYLAQLRGAWQTKTLEWNNVPRVMVSALSQKLDGSGGAYHLGCSNAMVFVDASLNQPPHRTDLDLPSRTCALAVAEFAEVFQAVQIPAHSGWNCGQSHGEGLSRVWAETLVPGAIHDFRTAWDWLCAPADPYRPNWVDVTEDTDQHGKSIGCAVLFIYWLKAGCPSPGPGAKKTMPKRNLGQICYAGAPTLAGVYQRLGGQGSAWDEFSLAAQVRWQPGGANGTSTWVNVVDNPW